MSQTHIRMLLGQMHLGPANLDILAVQLTAALAGPILLYFSAADLTDSAPPGRATARAELAGPYPTRLPALITEPDKAAAVYSTVSSTTDSGRPTRSPIDVSRAETRRPTVRIPPGALPRGRPATCARRVSTTGDHAWAHVPITMTRSPVHGTIQDVDRFQRHLCIVERHHRLRLGGP
jgi:hypothetical protein